MASMKINVRTRIAWWVRPALAITFLCGRVCPSRVDYWIDAIVDRGVEIEFV